MPENEQRDRIIEIIAEMGELPVAGIKLASDLQSDLKLDSLAVVEITLALEEAFKIEVPDAEMNSLRTVGDVVACVKKYAKG